MVKTLVNVLTIEDPSPEVRPLRRSSRSPLPGAQRKTTRRKTTQRKTTQRKTTPTTPGRS